MRSPRSLFRVCYGADSAELLPCDHVDAGFSAVLPAAVLQGAAPPYTLRGDNTLLVTLAWTPTWLPLTSLVKALGMDQGTKIIIQHTHAVQLRWDKAAAAAAASSSIFEVGQQQHHTAAGNSTPGSTCSSGSGSKQQHIRGRTGVAAASRSVVGAMCIQSNQKDNKRCVPLSRKIGCTCRTPDSLHTLCSTVHTVQVDMQCIFDCFFEVGVGPQSGSRAVFLPLHVHNVLLHLVLDGRAAEWFRRCLFMQMHVHAAATAPRNGIISAAIL